jgi:hypothetical protein
VPGALSLVASYRVSGLPRPGLGPQLRAGSGSSAPSWRSVLEHPRASARRYAFCRCFVHQRLIGISSRFRSSSSLCRGRRLRTGSRSTTASESRRQQHRQRTRSGHRVAEVGCDSGTRIDGGTKDVTLNLGFKARDRRCAARRRVVVAAAAVVRSCTCQAYGSSG